MSKNLDRCRRLLGECSGEIHRYAGLAEAPKGGRMSPGELATWRNHLINRTNQEIINAVDRIYVGAEGAHMNDPQKAWQKTGKKVHDALKKIEGLLDDIAKTAKTVS